MANIVVVGAQWGDEAKGKVVDYLAPYSDMVVRYGGGNNAGHSVIVGTELYKFHLVPSGILNQHLLCVIADGVVIDPGALVLEIEGHQARGLTFENLRISAGAHIILPYHRLLDQLSEADLGAGKIGTTGRGIGPAYTDKAARIGIRMGDLIDPTRFRERLQVALEQKNAILTRIYNVEPFALDVLISEYAPYAEKLKPYIQNTSALVHEAATNGRGVLFEGAQGTLLDLDLGTYPFVTSSHPTAGGACIGTGIGPTLIDGVIGVAKAYTTRVGAGIFPTELLDKTGAYIRERGREYGTTTGRPRRCGWLDTVILRYAARVNGLSFLALGHLDVLAGLERVEICSAYRTTDGDLLRELPADLAFRTDISPVYETLPGWTEDVSGARDFNDLPVNARRYVERVQELAGLRIGTLSVGPAREQTIVFGAALSDLLSRRGRG